MDTKEDKTLKKLKAANLRLRMAINHTIQSWPYTKNCWIDQISEPTKLLGQYRIENGEDDH